jgi:hypothetical protein
MLVQHPVPLKPMKSEPIAGVGSQVVSEDEGVQEAKGLRDDAFSMPEPVALSRALPKPRAKSNEPCAWSSGTEPNSRIKGRKARIAFTLCPPVPQSLCVQFISFINAI